MNHMEGMWMNFIGVDLGGTNIKAGIVNEQCEIIAESDRPTALPRSAEAVCDDILLTIADALRKAGLTCSDIGGVGVGCPGTVLPDTGVIAYSNNLGWRDFPMRDYLETRLGLAVLLGNDANVAALGEVCAGSAKGASSAVVVTLGTGVGSGVVLDGKILTGFGGGASEIGHMVIERGGRLCTCGRRGCLESYASATGLINLTNEAMAAHPESAMHQIAPHGADGRTAFLAQKQGDAAGAAVVTEYIDALACGLTGIINIFYPEIISLGGGVSKEGENLLAPLREKTYAEVFGGNCRTRIEVCTLGYKAGIIGAAMLARDARDAGDAGK